MTEPTACDCCHADDGGWTTLALTVGELSDPRLPGADVRILTHAAGQDGRLHLVETARGRFAGGHVADEAAGTIDGIALDVDGESEPQWWGPMVADRHLLQVAR